MPGAVLGTATIVIDGEERDHFEDAELTFGGVTRTPVKTAKDVHFTAKNTRANLTLRLPHAAGFDLAYWRGLEAAQVQVQADTGQIYVIRAAFQHDEIKVKEQDDGKVELQLAGLRVEIA